MVLLPDADLPADSALLDDLPGSPVHVFCRDDVGEVEIEQLEKLGAKVHPVPGEGEHLDLGAVLGACRELGIRSILCEGGLTLAHALLGGGHVHRFYLLVAPDTFGQPGGPPERFGRDTLIVLDRGEA